MIGVALAAAGITLTVVQAVLVVLAASGRRAADAGAAGPLTSVAVSSLGVAALGLLVSLTLSGPLGLVTGLPVLGVYAAPGIGLLLGLRSG